MADPMQAAAPAADPSAAPADDAATDTPGGFTVELKVDAQGKMSVSVEPAAAEAGEGDDSGEEGQAVANIGEALKLIKEICIHGGEMADTGASSDDMASGYGS